MYFNKQLALFFAVIACAPAAFTKVNRGNQEILDEATVSNRLFADTISEIQNASEFRLANLSLIVKPEMRMAEPVGRIAKLTFLNTPATAQAVCRLYGYKGSSRVSALVFAEAKSRETFGVEFDPDLQSFKYRRLLENDLLLSQLPCTWTNKVGISEARTRVENFNRVSMVLGADSIQNVINFPGVPAFSVMKDPKIYLIVGEKEHFFDWNLNGQRFSRNRIGFVGNDTTLNFLCELFGYTKYIYVDGVSDFGVTPLLRPRVEKGNWGNASMNLSESMGPDSLTCVR